MQASLCVSLYMSVYVYVYVCICAQASDSLSPSPPSLSLSLCVCVCVCVCTHVSACIYLNKLKNSRGGIDNYVMLFNSKDKSQINAINIKK